MQILILLISLIFSFVFYLFYCLSQGMGIFGGEIANMYEFQSFSGNLMIETSIFIIIGFIFFFSFSSFNFGIGSGEKIKGFSVKNFVKYTRLFFRKYIYYVGFVLFYLSMYFIFSSMGYKDFSLIILFISVVTLVLFFVTHKFFILRDFVKVNTILFSVYYIYFYILFFISGENLFNTIDFINSNLVFCFFLLSVYSDKKLLKKEKSDKGLVFYFFLYCFIFISFYLNQIIGDKVLVFNGFGLFMSIFIFFFVIRVRFFKNSSVILKSVALIFLYVSTISGIYYTYRYGLNFAVIFSLLYSMLFNYYIHDRYQNYLSLLFSSISFIFLSFYLYFNFFHIGPQKEFMFICFSLTVSSMYIILSYVYKLKYSLDIYFFSLVGYLINISSVIYFFFITQFELFNFGVILLFESIYVFFSYYKLKSAQK